MIRGASDMCILLRIALSEMRWQFLNNYLALIRPFLAGRCADCELKSRIDLIT